MSFEVCTRVGHLLRGAGLRRGKWQFFPGEGRPVRCGRSSECFVRSVEGLYRQKQSRESELERVKAVARGIIEDPVTSDKHRVREMLAELQEKWQDLSDRLVQMISYSVSCISDQLCTAEYIHTYILLITHAIHRVTVT